MKLLETLQMNLQWKNINFKNTSIECILSSTINGLQPKKLIRPKKTMAKINLCWKILISEWYQKFFKWSNFLRHFSVEDKFKNERFHCFFNSFYWESKERHLKSPKRFTIALFLVWKDALTTFNRVSRQHIMNEIWNNGMEIEYFF